MIKLTPVVDLLLATAQERQEAALRARHAQMNYGEAAIDILARKLGDPRRRSSRRSLRLAIRHLKQGPRSRA